MGEACASGRKLSPIATEQSFLATAWLTLSFAAMRRVLFAFWALAATSACSSSPSTRATSDTGSSATSGSPDGSSAGGTNNQSSSAGGTNNQSSSLGGATGAGASSATTTTTTTNAANNAAVGGASSSTDGATTTGGATSMGGTAGSSTTGEGGTLSGPGSYALPPPSTCHNQNFVDFDQGCVEGDPSSTCGGKCNTINACQENSDDKPNADVTFICPRFMLFSDAMMQAAIDDGNSEFNYAIVGHDVDQSGIDGSVQSTCCQCYQLVFAYPSPQNERQAQQNPDNPEPPASGIPIPKPLIVQSFNTAATPNSFDIYMAAGGFGANNACAPGQQPEARSGQYLYTAYPTDGQPSQGGVKPVSLYTECKTQYQWVTTETLSSDACQNRIADACNQLESSIPGLTEQSRRSCIQANSPESPYHLNWSVYAMKVECPEHLTEVTGCKLAPQGLPAVDKGALTAEAAALNTEFWVQGSNGNPYETTTMEDCCRPSCASNDWVAGMGLPADAEYDSFYSCDASGTPFTE